MSLEEGQPGDKFSDDTIKDSKGSHVIQGLGNKTTDEI